MDEQHSALPGVSRREALKRAGVVAGAAGVVWATPSVTTLGGVAFAAGTAPAGGGTRYDLSDTFTGSKQPEPFLFTDGSSPLSAPFSGAPAHPSLVGLSGTEVLGGTAYPIAAKNNGSGYTDGSFSIGSGDVLVHPAQSSPLEIDFTAPTAGDYSFTFTVQRLDGGPGNGITYAFPLTGLSGTVTGQGSTTRTVAARLTAGQVVTLQIGNNGDYTYDSTRLEYVVTGP